MPEFGELKNVALSNAWKHEERDFTPWMAKQDILDKLAREVRLPSLELVERESRRGSLKADIVAKSVTDERTVVIENQLIEADYDHLGRTIGYAAAFEAEIIVWIARSFRDDTLAAVKWLNDHSREELAFFAVEIEVFQIGDSDLAPKFKVRQCPTNWNPEIRRSTSPELENLRKIRSGFWLSFMERFPEDLAPRPNPIGSSYWVQMPRIRASLNLSRDGVGMFLSPRFGEDNLEAQAFIKQCHAALENRGIQKWDNFEGYNQANWPEMVELLHTKLLQYREVIERLANDFTDQNAAE